MAKKKQGKVRRAASNVILVCLIMIFLISAYNVVKILYNYHKDQKAYDDINKLADSEEFTGDIDFDALRKVNPDIVGWIYLEGTKINYPIVQGSDNSKYLHTLFDGSYGGAGCLFVDCATDDPFNQFSTVVYGHHMKDGSMFNRLKDFKDQSYEEEHSRFELITPDNKYHLDVVAFFNQPSDSPLYTPNHRTEESRKSYISLVKKKASYLTGIEFNEKDKLVLLSTCAYEYEGARYMVLGKLIPWE